MVSVKKIDLYVELTNVSLRKSNNSIGPVMANVSQYLNLVMDSACLMPTFSVEESARLRLTGGLALMEHVSQNLCLVL